MWDLDGLRIFGYLYSNLIWLMVSFLVVSIQLATDLMMTLKMIDGQGPILRCLHFFFIIFLYINLKPTYFVGSNFPTLKSHSVESQLNLDCGQWKTSFPPHPGALQGATALGEVLRHHPVLQFLVAWCNPMMIYGSHGCYMLLDII